MIKDFGIEYNNENRCFTLQMEHSTYIMGIVGADITGQTGDPKDPAERKDYLGHIYYGKKLRSGAGRGLLREKDYSYMEGMPKDKCTFMDGFPFEYSFGGTGDFRPNSLEVRNADGFTGCELTYKTYRILSGKKKLEGLPATFGTEEDTATLEIDLEDRALGLVVTLSYSIFRGLDVVARSVRVENKGNAEVTLEKVLSACIELPWENREIVTLSGSWARERFIDRRPIGHGRIEVGSKRGISSHQEHPFMAVVTEDAGETRGEVLGLSFVYSGSFVAEVERTQHDALRVGMGISDYDFRWRLAPGEGFTAPEVVLCYSGEGFGGMTGTFHKLFREHLIRSPFLHKKRPVLINNWEATYFDFNKEKLLEIARVAKSAGIEMLVMDDGWFGHRSSDNSSLGDWVVNEEKLPGGMKALADAVNEIGLKLGVWFEPEMVCPDSDLYREHPDWAIAIPGRKNSECRSQFVLDLTRKEVRDYVVQAVAKVLHSANIEYVKWDMNRPLTDLGSAVTAGGEILHRYMLGVYELQERLLAEFPNLLLENCSSGGARFDPGMLYYSPQIWCSDDTDAIERLSIQEGTALIYPPSVIGAHVSICPNHLVGRTTAFSTRGVVALAGTFGYELDITRLSEEELRQVSEQVQLYHQVNDLVREGDFYRIKSVSALSKNKNDRPSYAWMSVARDKSEALLSYVQVRGGANERSEVLYLAGLDPEAVYTLPDGRVFGGDWLMQAGFVTDKIWGDGASSLYHFTRK
ncbi:MAG: alpha-galactosidase [Eubacterium sp.]|nr:alpha-galactosidase [Eubacterium sp.]